MARTRRASKLATPPLPLEIVADIIDLTIELLVEDELDLEWYAPLANLFLLSASLVNRAWHPIAVKALLKRGTVTVASAEGFLAQAKAFGVDKTLESVRFGEDAAGADPLDNEEAFDLLINTLSGVKNVELVETGSDFRHILPKVFERISIVNPDLSRGDYLRKFARSVPKHLVISDQPRRRKAPGWHAPVSLETFEAMDIFLQHLYRIPHIKVSVTGGRDSNVVSLSIITKLGMGEVDPPLETCHFECTSMAVYTHLIEFTTTVGPLASSFPHLTHLAANLLIAHHLALPGPQASLSSLEILPDPPGDLVPGGWIAEKAAEPVILELIEGLSALTKLTVPACWASDAVKECCEAKGVELVSD
ncbi:hypothetical protein RQP46_007146 [Phenoliferia psychrophenolica]